MLRHTETPDKIVIAFTKTKIRNEVQIQDAGEELFELCHRAASAGKKLTLDLEGVQFMSSAILGKLVTLNKLAKDKQVNFRIVSVEPAIMETLKFMRLDRVFRFDDRDDGPDSLGNSVPPSKPPNTDGGRAEPPGD